MTARAIWNDTIIAESKDTVRVEGNHYFPASSVRWEHLTPTRMRSLCPWKGIARYYTITADGAHRPNAAWQYPHPSPLARKVKNRVAFYADVDIIQTDDGQQN